VHPVGFIIRNEVWNKQEIILDLNRLSSAQHKRSQSQTHVTWYLHLKLQQTVNLLLDAECRINIPKHSERVKKNRIILHRFIDAVCYLANQEFPFQGHNMLPTSLIKGNFVEFRSVLKNRGALLVNHLNSAIVI